MSTATSEGVLNFNIADLAAYAGDEEYKGLPVTTNMDELKLGTDGKFYVTHYSGEKTDGAWPIDDMGESVEVVVLKVRRKIEKWDNHEMVVASHEYSSRTAKVKVAVKNGDEVEEYEMTEKEAKEKYGAKVPIILYVMVVSTGTVVKLKVTGQSLYNPDDTESLRLYSYLQTFEGEQHSFMFVTKLVAKVSGASEDGKPYYNITFVRGDELDVERLNRVGGLIVGLKTTLDEADKVAAKRSPIYKKKDKEDWSAPVKKIEYPTEDIDVDDIPF